jgi:hypothetical protein
VDVTDYIIGLHKKEVVSTLFRQYGMKYTYIVQKYQMYWHEF